jgi:chitinase
LASSYFSSAVSSPQNRQVFVQNIVDTYHHFNLDGIEIDWEYPGREGQDGNQVDHRDSENLLSFLQLLRTSLPRGAKITAAVAPQTFADEQGQPMKDCSGFAKVLDWILIMNYDTFDGWFFMFYFTLSDTYETV